MKVHSAMPESILPHGIRAAQNFTLVIERIGDDTLFRSGYVGQMNGIGNDHERVSRRSGRKEKRTHIVKSALSRNHQLRIH